MKINFDKYDATCENGVWTWHIKNKDNTKTIAVKVTFKKDTHDVFSYQLGTLLASAEVDKIYFEDNNDTLVEELYSLKPVVVSLDDENVQDTNAKIDELIEKYERK